LDRLVAEIEGHHPLSRAITESDLSANQYLIFLLAKAFERFFRQQAGFTRDPVTEDVTGPFVDFAEAALTEIKSRLPRDTIARFLSKALRDEMAK
jgi:hypothetical protein